MSRSFYAAFILSAVLSGNSRSVSAGITAYNAVPPFTPSNTTVPPLGNSATPTLGTPTIVQSPFFHTTVQALGPPDRPAAQVTTTNKDSTPYFHTTVPALGPPDKPAAQVTTTNKDSTPYFHTTVPALGPPDKPAAQVTSTTPTTQPDLAPEKTPSPNGPQASGNSGTPKDSPSPQAPKETSEPNDQGQPPAHDSPSNAVFSNYVAAGQTVIPIASNAVIVGGATVVEGAPAKTAGGSLVSLGPSYLAIGSSTVPLPTPAATSPSEDVMTDYVAAGKTFIPIASNEVVVGGATISEGAQAKTVDGAKVSLGVSDLVIGASTLPRPTQPTTTDFTAAGVTVVPFASNEVIVGGATVTRGAPAKTIEGTKISLGVSDLVVGSSTVALPTAATSSDKLGGLITSGLGSGPSPKSSASGTTAAFQGAGIRVGGQSRSFVWTIAMGAGGFLVMHR